MPDATRSMDLFIDSFNLIVCATEKIKEVINEPKNRKTMPSQKFIPSTLVDNDCESLTMEVIHPYSNGKIVEKIPPPVNITSMRFNNSRIEFFILFAYYFL
jgi:hypothetical protein